MSDIIPTEKHDLTISEPLPLDQHPALVYLAGLANDKARRVQKNALETIAGFLGADMLGMNWAVLRYQHCNFIRSKLAEGYAPASANRMLAALRGALKAAFLLGQMKAEDYQKAIMVKAVTGERLPAGRELSQGELAALMGACEDDPTAAGVRDAAIIALAYSCGLRREEIVNLSTYNPQDGKIVIKGKRNKERTGYLTNGAKRAMDAWLELRGYAQGTLFCAINKGGRLAIENGEVKPMTPQAVYNMLAKRAEQAGIDSFSPHDLRRTFVSDLLERGADISTVSKMAGHANVSTTALYDRRPEAEKVKAAGLLHVPYKGK